MAGKMVLGVMVLLASAAWARGEMKTLQLKDGSSVTGDVTETAGGYLVKSRYGSREISRGDVAKVTDALTFMDEYKQKLAGIDAKSAEDHFKLGEWAYGSNQAGVAEKEVRQALAIDKEHAGAKKLLDLLTAGTGPGPGDGGTEGSTGTTGTTGTVKPGEFRLVVAADIDKIRLTELSANENQLPIQFRNGAEKRFLETKAGQKIAMDPNALQRFRSATPVAKALQIRDALETETEGADILKDVVVKADPRVMARMRAEVWPLLPQTCGSAKCPGGAKLNGAIRLVGRTDAGAPGAYTNFVILDGAVDKKNQRVIDRNEPTRSLLLQYGLPNDSAPEEEQLRHPKVKGWFPTYKSRGEQAYRTVLGWIGSLRKDRPGVALEFTPPEGVKLDFGGSLEGILQPVEPLGGAGADQPANGGPPPIPGPETMPEKSSKIPPDAGGDGGHP